MLNSPVQWSSTFFAPGTGFMEVDFSIGGAGRSGAIQETELRPRGNAGEA